MKNSRVLIFGGTGFIGSELEKKLIENKFEFMALGRSHRQEAHNSMHFNSINFFDFESWKDFIQESDVVIFLIPCHMPARADGKTTEEQYVNSFKLLLDICKKNKIKKFLFLSSGGAIYGEGESAFFETDKPCPKSAYGNLKLRMEQILLQGEYDKGFSVCIVRPSNVYGESQNPQLSFGAVTTFFYKITNNQTIEVFGDLDISKDYLHVEDLTNALIQLIPRDLCGIYNLAYGKSYTLKNILEIMEQLLGKKAMCKFHPLRDGDIYKYQLDISKAQRDFGFSPKIDLPEGISRYLNQNK